LTAQEAIDYLAKIPERQRSRQQDRVYVFLDTIRRSPNKAAWEKMRHFPIPPDIARQLGDVPAPPPEPSFADRIRKFLF
jgi:hypothetical protein